MMAIRFSSWWRRHVKYCIFIQIRKWKHDALLHLHNEYRYRKMGLTIKKFNWITSTQKYCYQKKIYQKNHPEPLTLNIIFVLTNTVEANYKFCSSCRWRSKRKNTTLIGWILIDVCVWVCEYLDTWQWHSVYTVYLYRFRNSDVFVAFTKCSLFFRSFSVVKQWKVIIRFH